MIPATEFDIKIVKQLILLVIALNIVGCSVIPQKPWVESYQRSFLEDRLMSSSRHESIQQFRHHTDRNTGTSNGGGRN